MTREEYTEYLRDEFGRSCEFLTVVELSQDYLGRDLSNQEAREIHDEVVQG